MSFDVNTACYCVTELQNKCAVRLTVPSQDSPTFTSYILDDPDFGRMAYTVSILLMFSLVILMLMLRSIRRSPSSVQMETLLETMRFREELDMRERQRRRLLTAKKKVSAWLTRANGDIRGWKSSPALMQQRRATSSTVSEIPRVVVTGAGDSRVFTHERVKTPCLSMIYDFTSNLDEVSVEGSFTFDMDDTPPPPDLPLHLLTPEC